MATSKRRLNITLPKDLSFFLKKIAIRDDVPEATKARQLIEMAMELEEDAYFSAIADRRARKSAGWMSHKEFWSKVL